MKSNQLARFSDDGEIWDIIEIIYSCNSSTYWSTLDGYRNQTDQALLAVQTWNLISINGGDFTTKETFNASIIAHRDAICTTPMTCNDNIK